MTQFYIYYLSSPTTKIKNAFTVRIPSFLPTRLHTYLLYVLWRRGRRCGARREVRGSGADRCAVTVKDSISSNGHYYDYTCVLFYTTVMSICCSYLSLLVRYVFLYRSKLWVCCRYMLNLHIWMLLFLNPTKVILSKNVCGILT